ncbi:MAG: enoyl-CoA hydratase/isomerase family protein [Planctomycetota bacterium]|nr:MAG: enoyl-CoA hydratase/isomerase family protein [Planctomycetota bacterium]
MVPMSELAALDVSGRSAVLTLHRPEQRNALSLALVEALHARVDELERLEDVTVLTITGAGRAFSAGMDLKEVLIGASRDAWPGPRLLESLARLTVRVRALPMVVVAQVNGAAIGGGCGLMCVADIAITHADAKIGYPEVDLGLCPAVVSPWVVRKIGAGAARRVLLSGGVMSGSEAYAVGLVDHLVSTRDELDSATGAIVERLCSGGARALRATKALLNDLDGSVDEEVVVRGAALSAEVLGTDEAQAALRARMS